MTTHKNALQMITLQSASPDMLAMMAYLRDAPAIGLHVPGRPDITGARLQSGIRFLINGASAAAKIVAIASPAIAAPQTALQPARRATRREAASDTVKAFLTALQHVARAADSRHSVPVLQCVRITVRNGLATLECTDMEMAMVETFAVDAADMDIVTPVKPLIAALKAMSPSAAMTLVKREPATSAKDDLGLLAIGNATFALLSPEDFPLINPSNWPTVFTMPVAELRHGLESVQHAISTEETRYYLNGVLWTVRNGRLRMVTTDGHRLALYPAPALPNGAATMPDMIVPRVTIATLLAVTNKAQGEIRIRCSGTRIEFTLGAVKLMSKLVDGTFPEFERVIPQADGTRATFNRAEFIAAVKAGKAVASDRSGPVRLEVSADACTISARNHEGQSTRNEIGIRNACIPDAFEVGYQAKYLLDAVDALPGDIVFEWNTEHAATSPVRISSSEYQSETLLVLMPMRV